MPHYTYRKTPNSCSYEVGEIYAPRSHPEEWCDRRLCEGFWGNEAEVANMVKMLNIYRKRFKHCPECGAILVQPRTLDDYCEDCGWPDEVRL